MMAILFFATQLSRVRPTRTADTNYPWTVLNPEAGGRR
jgi:hypothetical protein